MNKKDMVLAAKIVIPITLVCITGVFVGKFIKEYKRQLSDLQKDMDNYVTEAESRIEDAESKAEKAESNLKEVIFADPVVDGNGYSQSIENAELDEMRRRPKSTVTNVSSKEAAEKLIDLERSRFIKGSNKSIKSQPIVEQIVKDEKVWNNAWEKQGEEPEEKDGDVLYEVEKMNFDKDDIRAWEAFKENLLLDIDGNEEDALATFERFGLPRVQTNVGDIGIIMGSLFNFDITSSNDYDHNIIEDMMSNRIAFFGPNSKYTLDPDTITFGEVLLYWANLLANDTDSPYIGWLCYMIAGLNLYSGDITPVDVTKLTQLVMEHNYDGPLGFGIFGLDDSEYHPAFRGINGRMIDEYNVFITRISDNEDTD